MRAAEVGEAAQVRARFDLQVPAQLPQAHRARIERARVAFLLRHQVGPTEYRTDFPGGILIYSAMILFGVSLALFLRSPLRAPLGERLFRFFWLGPIGRAFIRFGGRKTPSRPTTPRPVTAPAAKAAPTPTPVAIPPAALPQLAALESRVAELEKWRRESRV